MNSSDTEFIWNEDEAQPSVADDVSIQDRDANILLESIEPDEDEHPICGFLSSLVMSSEWNALVVTYGQSPERRLETWREHVDGDPENVTVLSVQGSGSGSRGLSTTMHNSSGAVTFEKIGDPSDLVRLGLAISDCLIEWEESDQQGIICFDSITSMLQFTDVKRAFRFFHTLKQYIESKGAIAHYHIDPTAFDEQTLRTLHPLFDEIVQTDAVKNETSS